MTPPSSSRNIEVREYSRRVGGGSANNNNFITSEPLLFTQGFNSDAFYRSAFQPQIFTDDVGHKRIEMKLDVNKYQPNEIKVSVNGNDLVVQAEHNDERPPTSSARAYFYKQITLPPNTDLGTISSQYHADGRLHITAKLSPEQGSIRYN
jgi:HSP20 family molecular chaperone IbpA